MQFSVAKNERFTLASNNEETYQLQLFFTMYSSFSDESAGFGSILDSLCNKDETYSACTDERDRLDQRDEIKWAVLTHLTDGLERCGEDRSALLQSIDFDSIDEMLSECYGLIDDIDKGLDPDEIDIESTLDDIRSHYDEAESMMASSSWFAEWEKDKYAIEEFAECLRELRVLQEHQLGAMGKRVEQVIADLKAHYEQKVAARHTGASEAEEGNDI